VEQSTYRPGARISAEVDLYDVPGIARVTARFARVAVVDEGNAHKVEEGNSIVLRGHGPGEKTTEQRTTDTGEESVTKTTVTLLGHVPEQILPDEYKCVSLEVQDSRGDRHNLDYELLRIDYELATGFRILDSIRIVDPHRRLQELPGWRFETETANVRIERTRAFLRHIQAAAKQHMHVIALLAIASVGVLLLQLAYVAVISGVYGLGGAAKFGDMFGFITALFTGIGFVGIAATIFTQLQDIKRQEEERTKEQVLQRRINTMKMVSDMEHEFESERMRKLRYKACRYFLDADDAPPLNPRDPTREESIAVKDTLNFLERVAHFTNEDLVDDDLVLSAFFSRLLVYFHYTNKHLPRSTGATEQSPYSLTLIELRRLSERGIKDWIRWTYDEQLPHWIKEQPQRDPAYIRRDVEMQYNADIEYLYSEDVLRRGLEGEHQRGLESCRNNQDEDNSNDIAHDPP
jgi:hypothetical protein